MPQEMVNKLRVQAAETALPMGGVGGYEIFDKTDSLGATNFVQNLNLVRALEASFPAPSAPSRTFRPRASTWYCREA